MYWRSYCLDFKALTLNAFKQILDGGNLKLLRHTIYYFLFPQKAKKLFVKYSRGKVMVYYPCLDKLS